MDAAYIRAVRDHFESRGVRCDPGLSAPERVAAERRWGFRFPPDLANLLGGVMPLGPRFYNWRDLESDRIADSMQWPADGICFEIERHGFWFPSWGPKPTRLDEACRLARHRIARAPVLIPVFAHRFLPATPRERGNPIFSVYGADIIQYGLDLPSYLESEFGVENPYPGPETAKRVEFWTEIERRNC